MGTSSGWSDERRVRQSERIRQVKPWEKSTGPKSAIGKQISSQNARKFPEVVSPHFEVMIKVAARGAGLTPGWSANPLVTTAERTISIDDAMEIVRKLAVMDPD